MTPGADLEGGAGGFVLNEGIKDSTYIRANPIFFLFYIIFAFLCSLVKSKSVRYRADAF